MMRRIDLPFEISNDELQIVIDAAKESVEKYRKEQSPSQVYYLYDFKIDGDGIQGISCKKLYGPTTGAITNSYLDFLKHGIQKKIVFTKSEYNSSVIYVIQNKYADELFNVYNPNGILNFSTASKFMMHPKLFVKEEDHDNEFKYHFLPNLISKLLESHIDSYRKYVKDYERQIDTLLDQRQKVSATKWDSNTYRKYIKAEDE